jgi:hypothetical protein
VIVSPESAPVTDSQSRQQILIYSMLERTWVRSDKTSHPAQRAQNNGYWHHLADVAVGQLVGPSGCIFSMLWTLTPGASNCAKAARLLPK